MVCSLGKGGGSWFLICLQGVPLAACWYVQLQKGPTRGTGRLSLGSLFWWYPVSLEREEPAAYLNPA